MRDLAAWLGAIAVALVALALVAVPVWLAAQLQPAPPDDGLLREPAAAVGALVETADGLGVITARLRYGDGDRWQVRLASGRHVVVYRLDMRVLKEATGEDE